MSYLKHPQLSSLILQSMFPSAGGSPPQQCIGISWLHCCLGICGSSSKEGLRAESQPVSVLTWFRGVWPEAPRLFAVTAAFVRPSAILRRLTPRRTRRPLCRGARVQCFRPVEMWRRCKTKKTDDWSLKSRKCRIWNLQKRRWKDNSCKTFLTED